MNPPQRIEDGLVPALERMSFPCESKRHPEIFSPQRPEPGRLIQKRQALSLLPQRLIDKPDQPVQQELNLFAIAALKIDRVVYAEAGLGLELRILQGLALPIENRRLRAPRLSLMCDDAQAGPVAAQ